MVGYKIWYPVVIGHTAPAKDQFTIHAPDYPGIDSPANEPVFAAMERLGLVGTCIHIGQAHPRRWQNPVHFWTPIQQWLRVMDRHPRLVVVMAHMMNLFYSDEQLDFLGYVLETYPNLHVELGGRMIDFHAMQREHLREFFIRYADRIFSAPTSLPRRFGWGSSRPRRTITTSSNCSSRTASSNREPSAPRRLLPGDWDCRARCWKKSTTATPCGSTRV